MAKKLLVLVLSILVTAGFWLGTQLTVKQQLRKAPVVIAARDIPEHTKITADMLAVVNIPVKGVPPGVYQKKEEVVGKCTASGYGIAKNSFIFKAIVKNEEELPEGALLQVKPDEELVAMNIDLQKYLGGNAVTGEKVNLWFIARETKTKVPIVGMFARNIRIVGARDQSAMEIRGTPSEEEAKKDEAQKSGNNTKPRLAKVLLLAFPKNEVKYFFMAQAVGQIYPTGIGEAVQAQEGTITQTSLDESRKWLEENTRVLSSETNSAEGQGQTQTTTEAVR
ncbi:SAF domain-containing protein [Desulfurispora thermophila]|uniref:SAF domain-containing protein n=1 Tax=Desulfurispora thermophila TaxID=265470 RepID=UPI00036CA6EE|nr:SAF domain-containing protein [Desulfurispora thermophila]